MIHEQVSDPGMATILRKCERVYVSVMGFENTRSSCQRMERNYNQGSKDSEIGSRDWIRIKDEIRQHSLSPKFKGDSEIISNSKETESV